MFFISPNGHLFSEEEIAYIAQRAEDNFWHANEGKEFFVTENGYWIGTTGYRIGGQVFLVFGSPGRVILNEATGVPSFLSVLTGTIPYPAGAFHSLVGYAYGHRIMDGEAAPTQDQDVVGDVVQERLGSRSLYVIGLDFAGLQPHRVKRGLRLFLV